MGLPSGLIQLQKQHIEKRLTSLIGLIDDIQYQLDGKDDPRIRFDLRRQLEDVRERKLEAEEELAGLNNDMPVIPTAQDQGLRDQLKIIENKIDHIQNDVGNLRLDVLNRFKGDEQDFVKLLVERLDASQLLATNSLLAAIETSSSTGQELVQTIDDFRKELKAIEPVARAASSPVAEQLSKVNEIFDDPNLDAKHKLEISIPIIPYILTYKSEIGLGSTLNLSAAWDRFQNWTQFKNPSKAPR